MDHLTPGYRASRLHRKAHTARVLVWALLGTCTSLLLVLCALVAPEGLVIAGLLGGIMIGASRG